MTILILGLALFLGTHSIRIVANDWRNTQLARHGAALWRGGYALASLLGFGLIIWGFGLMRQAPTVLWHPPSFMRYASAALMLAACVLLAAAYVPRNRIKAAVHHPMLLATKLWAVAHLLSNGRLADVILFDSILVWAILAVRSARRRDVAAGTFYPAGTLRATLATIGIGVLGAALFAHWLHRVLIGIDPFA